MPTTRIVFGGFPDYMEPVYTGVTMSGTADAGYPVTRLRDRALYRKARLTATAEWPITWTYGGEVRDVSGICLADHNFPSGTNVQILLYASNVFTVGTTEPVYDSGVLDALLPVSTDFVSSESFAWGDFEWGGASPEDRILALPRNFIHLIMEASTSGDGTRVPRSVACGGGVLLISNLATAPTNVFASAGMLMTTKLWQPSRNFRWGWNLDMDPLGEAPLRSRHGRNWGRNYGGLRTMTLTLDLLSRGETLDFPWTFSFDRTWSSPLLVVPEPDAPEYWWACAGLFSIKPTQLFGMTAQATAQKLWNLGTLNLQEWK